ncbi:MAG: hypothetical protein H6657_05000 [Ardenticatenaceae bacterium]|nr:hypothetical protein [Ardenticatenaceae bacterium]
MDNIVSLFCRLLHPRKPIINLFVFWVVSRNYMFTLAKIAFQQCSIQITEVELDQPAPRLMHLNFLQMRNHYIRQALEEILLR